MSEAVIALDLAPAVVEILEASAVLFDREAGAVLTLLGEPVSIVSLSDPASVTVLELDAIHLADLDFTASVEFDPGFVSGPAGPQGPAGVSGDGGALAFAITAGANLSGHTVVKASGSGALPASSALASDAGKVIGITTGAASSGALASVQSSGEIEEPSWSWLPGPVYFTSSGTLTQTAPTTGFVQQIGIAISPTTLMVLIGPVLILS